MRKDGQTLATGSRLEFFMDHRPRSDIMERHDKTIGDDLLRQGCIRCAVRNSAHNLCSTRARMLRLRLLYLTVRRLCAAPRFSSRWTRGAALHLSGTMCRWTGRVLRPACCLPAPPSLIAHCVATCLAEPVTAIATISTVTEGIAAVLSKRLVDIEVDFLSIFMPLATQRQHSWHLHAAWRTGWRPRDLLRAAAALRLLGRRSSAPWDGPSGAYRSLDACFGLPADIQKVYACPVPCNTSIAGSCGV